jgi:hypothetical protein
MRRPVPALVRDRHPRREVLLEGGEGLERLVGQPVAFDMFHARFRLALRPGAIRRTRVWLHVPVAAEGEVRRMEEHRARRAVTRPHQRPRIVSE